MTTQNSIPGKLCALKKNNMAPIMPELGLKIRAIDFLLESAGKPGFVLL